MFNKRILANAKLETAMENALTLLKNYMGDEYSFLDDSKIPDIKESIQNIKAHISSLQGKIHAKRMVTYFIHGPKGNVIGSYQRLENVFSAWEIQEFQRQVSLLLHDLDRCERKLEKLEGLCIVQSQAEQIIKDAVEEIYSTYGEAVENTIVGNNIEYIV